MESQDLSQVFTNKEPRPNNFFFFFFETMFHTM